MDKNVTIKVKWHVRSPDGSRTNTIGYIPENVWDEDRIEH